MCVKHASLVAACLALLLPIDRVQAETFADNARVWMDLTTGEIHSVDERRLRSGPRINGAIVAGRFKPASLIE